MSFVMDTYSRLPVNLVRGKGCRLWDDKGNEYLDMVSGIAVCNLGHAHPKVVEALSLQAQNLFHCSNLYRIPQQEELAQIQAAVLSAEIQADKRCHLHFL